MRKSTLIWLVLTVVAGVALFYTTQQVTDGRQKLAKLQKNIQEEEETLRVLQAEWSYLNQPDRLEKLARQYLELQPARPRQFITLEAFEKTTGKTAGEAAPETAPETAAREIPSPSRPAPPLAAPVHEDKAEIAVKEPPAKPLAAPYKKPAAKEIPLKAAKKPVVPPAPALRQADGRDLNDVMKSLGVR